MLNYKNIARPIGPIRAFLRGWIHRTFKMGALKRVHGKHKGKMINDSQGFAATAGGDKSRCKWMNGGGGNHNNENGGIDKNIDG